MVEVVVKKLGVPVAGASTSIRVKTVVGADGQKVRIRTLNAESANFADDLTRVFRANVRKARKANKLLADS
ncbi:hypothetical protein [Ancylobacter oerskovii]|uniref:Uncharacterized protein n=1 Tax=Ancylobacter oerskovii TaxID=459519 RepID=A0ABW4YY58_9HYPH|nr:hypothetical protein [Ancylobacter oerskovii]MBS7541746.1 hypothetical protein [Ancylobacter oerskovii]